MIARSRGKRKQGSWQSQLVPVGKLFSCSAVADSPVFYLSFGFSFPLGMPDVPSLRTRLESAKRKYRFSPACELRSGKPSPSFHAMLVGCETPRNQKHSQPPLRSCFCDKSDTACDCLLAQLGVSPNLARSPEAIPRQSTHFPPEGFPNSTPVTSFHARLSSRIPASHTRVADSIAPAMGSKAGTD